jgi:predicted RNase H-like nuclease (RuvC/YqgF family)
MSNKRKISADEKYSERIRKKLTHEIERKNNWISDLQKEIDDKNYEINVLKAKLAANDELVKLLIKYKGLTPEEMKELCEKELKAVEQTKKLTDTLNIMMKSIGGPFSILMHGNHHE